MKNILIIEDEPDLLSLIKERIESELEANIIEAADGNRAIEILEKSVFDVVITDIIMSPVNGWQIIDFIKDKYPDTKIIIMTGSLIFQATSLKYSDIPFFLKPNLENLFVLIKKHLE